MSKKSVSIWWANFYFCVFIEHYYGCNSFFEEYLFHLPQGMESNALEKTTNTSVASRFFAQTPSKIRQIFRIYDVVDQFLWKPFWFFLRIFSVSGSMRLSIINLSHFGSMSYTPVVLGYCKVISGVKGECNLLSISLLCSEVYVIIWN